MQSRRLLVLFVAALIAVGAYLFIELPGQRAADRSREAASRLFEFDPAAIDRIEVDRGGDTLRFALSGTHWVMQSPLQDDAELGTVMPIAVNLSRAGIQRDLGAGDGLARYGLAPPRQVLRLFTGADTVAALALGDMTVDRAAVYARRGGGHVLLIPTSVREAVTLGVDDYRNRRVVVFDLDAVRAFEIHSRARENSAWRRGTGGRWFTVLAGDTVAGDSVAVPAVLRRLRGMRVRAFPAEPDTSAPSPLGVTIHKDDGSSQDVRFFHSGGAWLAKVSGNPRTVQVDDDPSDVARQSVATLRDRRVLQFDPAAAQRMTFTTADTSAVLVRAGERWALPNPALGDIDPRRAAELVRALRALCFERLQPRPHADPRDHPAFSLVIAGAGDTIIDELQCAPAPGDSVWVARSRSLGATCEVRADALRDIAGLIARLRR